MKKIMIALIAFSSISAFAENEVCGKVSELKIVPPKGASSADYVTGKIHSSSKTKNFGFFSTGLSSTLLLAKLNNAKVCIGNEPSSIVEYIKIKD